MKRTILILVSVVVISVVGCSPEKYKPGSQGDPSLPKEKASATSASTLESTRAIDVGDIESQVFIEASIDEAAKPAGMTSEMIQGMKNHKGLTTVKVPAPFPQTLQLLFSVVSDKAFPRTPVVIRAKIFREKDVIGEFATVIFPNPPTSLANPKPFEYRVNILEGLSALPDRLMVHAKAEVAVLAPTDSIDGVDPKTAQNAKGPNGALLSNPVVIEFVQNPGTPQQ